MSEPPSKNQPKKEQDAPYLKCCEKCMKFFTNQPAYQIHIKMKHQQTDQKNGQGEEQEDGSEEEEDNEKGQSKNDGKKVGNKSVPIRSRMLQIQRNELQDNIYTFLGELGEKNAEPVNNRAQIINFTNDQKLTGQTNYSVNKVIRTPYEEPLKCSDEVPLAEVQKSKYKDFLMKLKSQLSIIQSKIEEEREFWQLRDPMAPEEQVMDQFSLMDIKKLIQNYPKRKIVASYPHFSIFLLWVGRICKAPAFGQFFLILGEYLAQFYSIQTHKTKGQAIYDNWKNYYKLSEGKKIQSQLLSKLHIFDDKTSKKFIEYYVQWAQIFRALSI